MVQLEGKGKWLEGRGKKCPDERSQAKERGRRLWRRALGVGNRAGHVEVGMGDREWGHEMRGKGKARDGGQEMGSRG